MGNDQCLSHALFNHIQETLLMGRGVEEYSFGKNNSMGPLKGISPFAPKIFKSTVFTVCHTSVMKTSLRTCCSSNKYPPV